MVLTKYARTCDESFQYLLYSTSFAYFFAIINWQTLTNGSVNLDISAFGGLEVACCPLVPKSAGSNPAEAVGFLRVNKNPQHVGGYGCLSVVIVVCCQVEVSATN